MANQLRSEHSPAYIVEQLFERAANSGRNVIIAARLERQGRTWFSNYSPYHTRPFALSYEFESGQLQIEVSEEHQLEATSRVAPSAWEPIPGTGPLTLPVHPGIRFFRLRKF